jgi:uncharacterized hydrophobic protein (TIGR00271 family)
MLTGQGKIWSAMLALLRGLFRPRGEIYEDLSESRQFDPLYFLMLVMSCLIALLGLLVNSPAVIIGAMLISPLMGPILACGLALTLADWTLGGKALRNVVLSVTEVVGIAAAATVLSPLKEATPEVLARTNPNLMDLLIAFFSGLAGTLALTSRRGGLTIIPGVAIATAVMPPLATAGYGVATLQGAVAGGGFMLFFTNLTSIVISAALVFLLIGFRPREEADHLLVRYRILVAAGVLLVVSVPLLRTLHDAAQQAQLKREIASVLDRRLEASGQSRVSSLTIAAAARQVAVDVVAYTSRFIPPQEQQSLEALLAERLNRPVKLNLHQLRVETQDLFAALQARPAPAPTPRALPAAVVGEVQDRMESQLSSLLGPAGIQDLQVRSLGAQEGGTLFIEVAARVSSPTEGGAWSVAAAALGRDAGSRIELRATLAVGDPVPLRFPPREAQAVPADAAKLALLVDRATPVSSLGIAATMPAQADTALVRRRRVWLRARLRALAREGGEDPGLEADTARLQLIQEIRVVEPAAAGPA